MKWLPLNEHTQAATSLLTDYRLTTSNSSFRVEAGPHFNVCPDWQPSIQQNFGSVQAAEDFAVKFDTAINRLHAKSGNGFYKARLDESGHPCLVLSEKNITGPVKPEDRLTEYPADVSKVWRGQTLRGLMSSDGKQLAGGTRLTFDKPATLAEHAALDAQALEAPLTLASINGLLMRTERAANDYPHFTIARRVREAEDENGRKGLLVTLERKPPVFLGASDDGCISMHVCKQVPYKGVTPVVMREKLLSQRLAKADVVAMLGDLRDHPEAQAIHMDRVAHALHGKKDDTFNPTAKVELGFDAEGRVTTRLAPIARPQAVAARQATPL